MPAQVNGYKPPRCLRDDVIVKAIELLVVCQTELQKLRWEFGHWIWLHLLNLSSKVWYQRSKTKWICVNMRVVRKVLVLTRLFRFLFFDIVTLQFNTFIPTTLQLYDTIRIIGFILFWKIRHCCRLDFIIWRKFSSSKPFLHVWEKKVITGSQIGRIRRIREHIEVQVMKFCSNNPRHVCRCIFVVKKNFLFGQMWTFSLNSVFQLIQ